MKQAKVFYKAIFVGIIEENQDGYYFTYDSDYLTNPNAKPISLTLPLQKEPYYSKIVFPFFDGLIPEGWLLEIAIRKWKLDYRNRFELLITLCKDCIGCVSVIAIENRNNEY